MRKDPTFKTVIYLRNNLQFFVADKKRKLHKVVALGIDKEDVVRWLAFDNDSTSFELATNYKTARI